MKMEWLVTIIIIGPTVDMTHDIVTESQAIVKVSSVVHSGFVSQKLLQVAENCLWRTSDPPKNIHK